MNTCSASVDLSCVIDGESPFLLDLDNEMTSIATDSDLKVSDDSMVVVHVNAFHGAQMINSQLTSLTVGVNPNQTAFTVTVMPDKRTVNINIHKGTTVTESSQITFRAVHPELGESTVAFTIAAVKSGIHMRANLFQNSFFRDQVKGDEWTVTNGSFVSDDSHGGYPVFKMTHTNGSGEVFRSTATMNSKVEEALIPGQTYTISASVKGAGTGKLVSTIGTYKDAAVTLSSTWQRVSLTFTLPAGFTGITNTAYFELFRFDGGNATGSHVSIACPKLELGKFNTDWCMSEYDKLSATLYELTVNLPAIAFARTARGLLTPSSRTVTVGILKKQGDKVTSMSLEQAGLTLRYSYSEPPTATTGTATTTQTSFTIQSSTTNTYLHLALFKGTTLLDRESIPILKDGQNGTASAQPNLFGIDNPVSMSFPLWACKKVNTWEREFTQAQWTSNAQAGKVVVWASSSTSRSVTISRKNDHLAVGDLAYITGVVTDKYEADAVLVGQVTAIAGTNGTTSVSMSSRGWMMKGNTSTICHTQTGIAMHFNSNLHYAIIGGVMEEELGGNYYVSGRIKANVTGRTLYFRNDEVTANSGSVTLSNQWQDFEFMIENSQTTDLILNVSSSPLLVEIQDLKVERVADDSGATPWCKKKVGVIATRQNMMKDTTSFSDPEAWSVFKGTVRSNAYYKVGSAFEIDGTQCSVPGDDGVRLQQIVSGLEVGQYYTLSWFASKSDACEYTANISRAYGVWICDDEDAQLNSSNNNAYGIYDAQSSPNGKWVKRTLVFCAGDTSTTVSFYQDSEHTNDTLLISKLKLEKGDYSTLVSALTAFDHIQRDLDRIAIAGEAAFSASELRVENWGSVVQYAPETVTIKSAGLKTVNGNGTRKVVIRKDSLAEGDTVRIIVNGCFPRKMSPQVRYWGTAMYCEGKTHCRFDQVPNEEVDGFTREEMEARRHAASYGLLESNKALVAGDMEHGVVKTGLIHISIVDNGTEDGIYGNGTTIEKSMEINMNVGTHAYQTLGMEHYAVCDVASALFVSDGIVELQKINGQIYVSKCNCVDNIWLYKNWNRVDNSQMDQGDALLTCTDSICAVIPVSPILVCKLYDKEVETVILQ